MRAIGFASKAGVEGGLKLTGAWHKLVRGSYVEETAY
jgi:hypothetical protein